MKRPQSRPSSAAIPTGPAGSKSKPIKARKPINKKIARNENKRLTKVHRRNTNPIKLRKLSSEARRFTTKTRQRKIGFSVVFTSFGLLLLLVLATYFTPLLAVEKIEISGISRLQENSIKNALKSQIGKPLPQVGSNDIANALKPFALIESYSVVSLPPHTLRIEIAERQPIGLIQVNGTNYLYDPAGVKIGIANGTEKLPVISISGNPATSKNFKAAIEVLLALPASLLDRVSRIDANSKDDVTLILRGYAGQKIIWGDQSNSVLKSKVLDALIANQKETDRVTYDVSSPTAPVVLY